MAIPLHAAAPPSERRDLRRIFDDVPTYDDIVKTRLGGRPSDPVRVPDPGHGHAFQRGTFEFRYDGETLVIE